MGACFLFTACAAHVKVTHLPRQAGTPPPRFSNGIYYALPRTVVKVEVPVERTYSAPAPFREYALVFFPDLAQRVHQPQGVVKWKAAVIEQERVSYAVKNPVLSTFGEPDPDQVYFVELQDNKSLDQAISLRWTERGAVTGAKVSVDETAGDILVGALNLATGIVSRTAFGNVSRDATDKMTGCLVDTLSGDEVVIQAVESNDELAAGYCGLPKELRQPIIEAVKRDGGRQLKKVKKVVYDEHLIKLLTARSGLIMGTPPTSDLTASLRELGAAINVSRDRYFRGVEDTSSWTGVFEVRPGLTSNGTLAVDNGRLLRIHKNNGVCLLGVLAVANKPLPPEWKKQDCATAAVGDEEISVDFGQFAADRPGQMAGIIMQYPANDAGERSFYYRIPNTSITRLKQEGRTLLEAQQTIGQLGVIRSLPASAGSRSLIYDLEFVEGSGALRSLGLTTKALLQKGHLDAASASANALLDAQAKAEEAERQKKDQLNRLEREFKILDYQAKICAFRTAAGLPCTAPQ